MMDVPALTSDDLFTPRPQITHPFHSEITDIATMKRGLLSATASN